MYCKKCGKEIDEGAAFCPYCGDKVNGSFQEPDESNVWYGVLSFFLPLVGLIMFLVWQDKYPLRAKSAAKGLCACLIFYGALIVLSVLVFVLAFIGIASCNIMY